MHILNGFVTYVAMNGLGILLQMIDSLQLGVGILLIIYLWVISAIIPRNDSRFVWRDLLYPLLFDIVLLIIWHQLSYELLQVVYLSFSSYLAIWMCILRLRYQELCQNKTKSS